MIPITRPWLGDAELEAIRRPLASGWVTQGPEVAAFEREFAAFVGAAHVCAVSNCTVALHLALRTVGVGTSDEVITVSHSFIATANAVRYCGATPIFVDVDPGTFNMDPSLIEGAVTPRTRAILCVHQVGMPCDLATILRVAAKLGLPVVEDAACAIGSEVSWGGDWERIGKPHGDIACFSFHPRKLLTTGDGGMLTTSKPEWDRQFRLLRQHAMNIPDTIRHSSSQVTFESYSQLGFNYRMTDLQAAIGREQLKRIPEAVERRRAQAAVYRELLAGIPGLELPVEPDWARTNWQSFGVRLPDDCDQRGVMQAMLDAGVSTRRGIMCAHREPAYLHEPWSCGSPLDECAHREGRCARLRRSEDAQDRVVLLPMFHEMARAEQVTVASALGAACAESGRRER